MSLITFIGHFGVRIWLLIAASVLLCLVSPAPSALIARAQSEMGGVKQIALIWKNARPDGQLKVSEGILVEIKADGGRGVINGKDHFTASQEGEFRLNATINWSGVITGKGSTIVTVATKTDPFSFFLRDVSKRYPIYLPSLGVIVTEIEDRRSYEEIERDVRSTNRLTGLQQIESQPEESFDEAARVVRKLSVQTWLGLSRDMRIFAVGERLDWIQPRYAGRLAQLPEFQDKPVRYNFIIGRGWGAVENISRRLDDGVLPILHGTVIDGGINYHLTTFVALEKSPLTLQTLRGTDYLVADGYSAGHMFTKEQQAKYDSLASSELNQPEETVLCLRVEAVNTSSSPRYAWFKTAAPTANTAGQAVGADPQNGWLYDERNGFGSYKSGRVFAVTKLNGGPAPAEEMSVLLDPGETATFQFYLPHRPVSAERASILAKTDFNARLDECRGFWKQKLASAAQINLPEKRINEMVRAGLLHLDLITYGLEPADPIAPTIGVYSPIGSESSPIIQFMDSMGWHETARRALTYFLDKEHDDGFIQNFGGYMLETGAALWSLGEHYRYTRDDEWVRRIEPKLLKSCDFILKWRARNLREDLKGRGYGMLDGKTADPEDPFRSFMLNGYHYLGLKRVAEMLAKVDPAESQRLNKEAEAFKQDIRTAFDETMAQSPVAPLGDGSWCQTAAPWVDYPGPLALFGRGGKWFTHGTVTARDSLLGPLYLVTQEVFGPDERETTQMLNFHNALMTERNVAFSQPYYSPHPFVHLLRGEVKPFLKAYYGTVASLADRQTYTFWEHYFGASPHKTHEEGWFLMQTRQMLYQEQGETLKLLPGAPRAYLEDGKRIELTNVATYFGPVSLRVTSKLSENRIEAEVECQSDHKPKIVELRVPHPEGRKPILVKGGTYDATTETIRIAPFNGRASLVLEY
ncbi:MAG: hypothetical protein J2P21_28365 [Chloracidobacterium sp.]|nr:hypothetical protein [Chloracidobacterium sp.]